VTLEHWRVPERVDDAEAWMRGVAASKGRPLIGAIERVHVRPWSTVCRATAATSDMFLKVCDRVQAHEPALTAIVAREFPSLAPELIARHPVEPWMLLGDGGTKLREARFGDDLMDTWVRLLPRYAALQRALADRVDELRAAGVPDRGLDHLPDLLRAILADEGAARPTARERIRALLPAIERSCAELAAAGIGPSIDHADLHDNNVLVQGRDVTIIDWGDAGVTHPFLSLFVTFRFVGQGLGVSRDAAEIRRLRDAYLEGWSDIAPRRTLERAADGAIALGSISGALTWYRIISEIDGAAAASPAGMTEELDRIGDAFERAPRS
jgi:Ser/Thr protein kinase RdoA (MazF antagonist)